MTESAASTRDGVDGGFRLADQHKAFFDSFGFLNLRGLFAAEIDQISSDFDAFFAAKRALAVAEGHQIADGGSEVPGGSARERIDEAFGAPVIDTYEHLNFGGHRAIVPDLLESCPELGWLKDDPRVVGTAAGLIGPGFEYFGSEGNIFDCDTSWHIDAYGAPLDRFHIKLLFYLDPLDRTSGALRVLPGTNHHLDTYARQVRPGLFDRERTESTYGLGVEEVPAHVIDNEPGDLIVVNFRTAHATFNSRGARRLFTLNYREPLPA